MAQIDGGVESLVEIIFRGIMKQITEPFFQVGNQPLICEHFDR